MLERIETPSSEINTTVSEIHSPSILISKFLLGAYIFFTLHFTPFLRHLFLAFVFFHLIRIFLVPSIAYLSNNENYIDTDNVLRAFGYKPQGPCSLPRKVNECSVKERIHIVLISAQWDREPFTQIETEMSIKSILSTTKCKLFFHFLVTGELEEWYLSEMMKSIRAVPFDSVGPLSFDLIEFDNEEEWKDVDESDSAMDLNHRIAYSMHSIPVLWIQEQARMMHINISHHSGEAGFSKLFIPHMLWSIDRAIYIDIDMIFGGDIAELWKNFDFMENDKNLLYFMGDNHPSGHGARTLHPFCSCQLIMDLKRLREANVTKMALDAFGGLDAEEVWGFRGGDQWVWSMICKNEPKRCKVLPKVWNVSGCSKPKFLGWNSHSFGPNNTCWQVIHFNCVVVENQEGYLIRENSWADVYKEIKGIDLTSLI